MIVVHSGVCDSKGNLFTFSENNKALCEVKDKVIPVIPTWINKGVKSKLHNCIPWKSQFICFPRGVTNYQVTDIFYLHSNLSWHFMHLSLECKSLKDLFTLGHLLIRSNQSFLKNATCRAEQQLCARHGFDATMIGGGRVASLQFNTVI